MTRSEFEDINSWGDFTYFASEEDYSAGDIIYTEEIAEIIKDKASEIGYDDDWVSFAEWLGNIPTGYDYYRYDAYGDISGLSNGDLEYELDNFREYMEENDRFEEESEEAPIIREEQPSVDDEEFPVEDFTISELLSACLSDSVGVGK